MERPIKGGYILISLGLIALSTSAILTVDYERITKTKKHIVLTGIKVGDEIMPDVCVEPQMTDDGILFSNVYGFDILVDEDNSVTVSEHTSKNGYYLHKITDSNYSIKIVMNDRTPIDFSVVDTFPKLNEYLSSKDILSFTNNIGANILYDSANAYYVITEIIDSEITVTAIDDWTLTQSTDTVTEL